MSKLKEYLTKALAFPAEIHLESNSGCNARCVMCPRDGMERYQGDMSRELFIKAIDECGEHPEMTYIHFHMSGEPLLLDIDELCWRINYAREKNPQEFRGHYDFQRKEFKTPSLCFSQTVVF